MVRQALPMAEAGDLPQSELQQRRLGYRRLTDDPGRLALRAIEQAEGSLDMIESITDAGEAVLRTEWIAQARRVLPRARQRVGEELRSRAASRIEGLYVIVGPDVSRGRPAEVIAEAALRGGARVVQLRDKTGDRGDVLPIARRIRSLCDDHDALFIMNDDPAMALSGEAHGLHLGQTDLPVSEARRVVGHDLIVGRSNNSMEEIAASISAGVDYLAVGAVFATSTAGKSERPAVGTDLVARAKEIAGQPIVAIGGINRENVGAVVRAGADCVCVVAAVGEAADPEAAAAALTEAIQNAKSA
jgi:thiamine-phosphate diphosphorylase